MSLKYIPQLSNQNFVFPNNTLEEYDVDIYHQLLETPVYGQITSLSATSISSSAITINYNYVWNKNSSEIFINSSGTTNVLSVHVMSPAQQYYKPWRCVDFKTGSTVSNVISGNTSTTFTASQLSISGLTSGTYPIEFRMIGHRNVEPICQTLQITVT
jgi:hypothetical protein